MSRKTYTAEGAVSVGPYSHAVEAGNFVYLSGQTPVDPETGKLLEGNIAAQTEQCFKNCLNVLNAAGLTFDDVVKVTVFLTNMADFKEMNTIYAQKFSSPYPARSAIGVASLPLGANIEMEMIAKKN